MISKVKSWIKISIVLVGYAVVGLTMFVGMFVVLALLLCLLGLMATAALVTRPSGSATRHSPAAGCPTITLLASDYSNRTETAQNREKVHNDLR